MLTLRTLLRIFPFKRALRPWWLPPNSWQNSRPLSPSKERGLPQVPKNWKPASKGAKPPKASGCDPQTRQQLSNQPKQGSSAPVGNQSAKPPARETLAGAVQRRLSQVTISSPLFLPRPNDICLLSEGKGACSSLLVYVGEDCGVVRGHQDCGAQGKGESQKGFGHHSHFQ